NATGQRLHGGQAEALAERGEDERARGLVQPDEVVVRDEAGEDDGALQPARRHQLAQCRVRREEAIPRVIPHQHELERGVRRVAAPTFSRQKSSSRRFGKTRRGKRSGITSWMVTSAGTRAGGGK